MDEIWVVNASPLIVLAKLGRLDLLRGLPASVVVPEPVAAEVLAGPKDDPARAALESGWGTRVPTPAFPSELLEWGLGAGETAVIAVAREQGGCVAVLDDAQGRMCARSLNVPVRGTLGVLLLAARRGLVPSLRQALENLRAAGLYVDEKIIVAVLKSLGDKP
ncbi:MAG TPA: DUF3368 domain-containing protein [Planctomycetota bacterium]